MTKKQFLKKSKKALNETGGILLLIRELIFEQTEGNISNIEAYKKSDIIRKSLESIFFEFDKLNPPSKCIQLHLRILRALITLQESVNLNFDNLSEAENGQKEISENKLKESIRLLEEFREQFQILVEEVDTLLNKK